MKIESFKAGVLKRQIEYRSFSPSVINQEWTWDDPKINSLLEQATQSLGELNAFSLIVPDVDLFIQMHVVKEANTSSRIEGTRTNLDEALKEKEQINPEKRDDWQEVQNYVQAMNDAIAELPRIPLAVRLLKQMHSTLMSGVRGKHKTPGEFRRSQNWIGGAGLSDAVFIPPAHDEVPALMSDLEKFWHNDQVEVPHLVRVALSHYQFETIHPFLDGNGRIGRLLIPLYLVEKGLLAKPSLYLSDHLERHKAAYYDALMRVRGANDLAHWIRFFLVAVRDTARKGVSTFRAILQLRSEVEPQILKLGKRSANGHRLLQLLYRKPFVDYKDIAKSLEVSSPTAIALARDFIRLGIAKEATGHDRNRVYVFDRYYRLFME